MMVQIYCSAGREDVIALAVRRASRLQAAGRTEVGNGTSQLNRGSYPA